MSKKITHITYANHKMSISGQKCQDSAMALGYNSIYYKPEDIDQSFRDKNSHILEQSRGAGYWLWKPYIIEHALRTIGGTIFYQDSGSLLTKKIDVRDTLLFTHKGCIHGEWCKMDVIMEMGCEEFIYNKQLNASVMIFEEKDRWFVEEWLHYCQKDGYIDDSPSNIPNIKDFKEHRYDQSILTNLAYKHNMPMAVGMPASIKRHYKRNPGYGKKEGRPEW